MLRLTTVALLFAAASAYAQQPQQPQNPPQEHRGPPQEAFDACNGKKDGDAAQAKTPRGDVMSGTCRLVLVPSQGAADRNAPRERAPAK